MWYGSGLLFHGAAFCCVDTWRHPWAAEFRGLSQRLRLELQRELCVDEELSWVMKVKLIHRHRNLGWPRWVSLCGLCRGRLGYRDVWAWFGG